MSRSTLLFIRLESTRRPNLSNRQVSHPLATPLDVELDHDDQVAADCVEYPQQEGETQRTQSTEIHLDSGVQDLH